MDNHIKKLVEKYPNDFELGSKIREVYWLQQENFFKYTGLSGWTRTVQLAAFTMGKDLIRRNLDTIIELEKIAKPSKEPSFHSISSTLDKYLPSFGFLLSTPSLSRKINFP